MRPVAIHYPNHRDAPDAAYWVDDTGQIQAHEPVPSPSTLLASMTIFEKVNGVPWRQYFSQLADRNPDLDNWEVLWVRDDEDPRKVFDLLRRGSTAK